MRDARHFSDLLREVLVGLFCALLALSAVAEARTGSARLADPDHALFLCGGSGDPQNSDHDCDSCCLPMAPALPVEQTAYVETWRTTAIANLARSPTPSHSRLHERPWLRGPPALA